jgi:hypothetical protein
VLLPKPSTYRWPSDRRGSGAGGKGITTTREDILMKEKKTVSLDDYDVGTKSNEGVEIELRHPVTSDELGIFVTVVGRYSEKYQSAVREISSEAIKGAAAKKKKADPIVDATEKGVRLLALCTVSWRTDASPTINFHGKDHPYSVDAAIDLYTSKALPWVKEQIDSAVHSNANFMKP